MNYEHVAFDGRVTFHTRHVNLLNSTEINRVETHIKEIEPEFAQNFPGVVGILATVLVLTENITFDFQGDENPMLHEFKDFWCNYKEALENKKADKIRAEEAALKIAVQWRQTTSMVVSDEWIFAINATTDPYRKAALLPRNQMTESEIEELNQPDSPLEKSVNVGSMKPANS